jgi:hypothetical protein
MSGKISVTKQIAKNYQPKQKQVTAITNTLS